MVAPLNQSAAPALHALTALVRMLWNVSVHRKLNHINMALPCFLRREDVFKNTEANF